MLEQIDIALKELRNTKPLVLNLTNYVTMEYMANVLLALGAAPIMSMCDAELEELVQISSCVNINIGTLDDAFINRCNLAIELAKKYQKPIILDPVGAGATAIRTKTAINFAQHASIIRGNASEIMALAHIHQKTLGVESTHSTTDAKESAMAIANQYGCSVVVSGPTDYITDGKNDFTVPFGSALMSKITGMGCSLTAVLAAFRGISIDAFESSKLATLYFGLSGQLTEKESTSPGSYRIAFIDNLYATNIKKLGAIYAQ